MTVYHAKIRMALIAAQRIACGPLIAAAPAYGAVGVLVYRLGDDQIAHLPPPAASVCAARWAADFLYWENIAPLCGAWERQRG